MFVLLARDPLAPYLVECWARRRIQLEGDSEKCREALACAEAMRSWYLRKYPLGKPGWTAGMQLWGSGPWKPAPPGKVLVTLLWRVNLGEWQIGHEIADSIEDWLKSAQPYDDDDDKTGPFNVKRQYEYHPLSFTPIDPALVSEDDLEKWT